MVTQRQWTCTGQGRAAGPVNVARTLSLFSIGHIDTIWFYPMEETTGQCDWRVLSVFSRGVAFVYFKND